MRVTATSFADPADIEAFHHAKNQGMTDREAFRFGDNGIGFWGDVTRKGSGASCALPPSLMIKFFGSLAKARNRTIRVTISNVVTADCVVKDIMPKYRFDAIDLNPDACADLALRPPVKTIVDIEPR